MIVDTEAINRLVSPRTFAIDFSKGIIHLVRTCVYQRVTNNSFSENFAICVFKIFRYNIDIYPFKTWCSLKGHTHLNPFIHNVVQWPNIL